MNEWSLPAKKNYKPTEDLHMLKVQFAWITHLSNSYSKHTVDSRDITYSVYLPARVHSALCTYCTWLESSTWLGKMNCWRCKRASGTRMAGKLLLFIMHIFFLTCKWDLRSLDMLSKWQQCSALTVHSHWALASSAALSTQPLKKVNRVII